VRASWKVLGGARQRIGGRRHRGDRRWRRGPRWCRWSRRQRRRLPDGIAAVGQPRANLLDVPGAIGLGRDAAGALGLLQRRVGDAEAARQLALRGHAARLGAGDHDVIEILEKQQLCERGSRLAVGASQREWSVTRRGSPCTGGRRPR
jgi:hypothetical protein